MSLLTLTAAELAYGDLPLLDRASLALEDRERIGLIGRNGTGKSSLLGVLAGRVSLDDGELKSRDGLRIVLVPQEPAFPEFGDGARTPAHKLAEYQQGVEFGRRIAEAGFMVITGAGGGIMQAGHEGAGPRAVEDVVKRATVEGGFGPRQGQAARALLLRARPMSHLLPQIGGPFVSLANRL